MEIHPIANHASLPDMPSADNTDHDGRYVPYTGANAHVNLGVYNLIAALIKISSATGVSLSAANGILTITGLGDGYDENLILDFNTTANIIGVSSTGATEIDFGDIQLSCGALAVNGVLGINENVITSATGAISLGNDHLSGTGYLEFLSGVLNRGLLLENDECVANGDFSSAANWTTGGPWAIANNVATANVADDTTGALTQDAKIQIGKAYKLTFEITSDVGDNGTMNVTLGGVAVTDIAFGGGISVDTYEYEVTVTSTAVLSFRIASLAEGEEATIVMDNVSLKEISLFKTETRIGGTTNYARNLTDGSKVFVGTAGLPEGCMEGVDETVICTTQNTWYQVTFDTAISSNLTTINLTNNDMAVTYEGFYKVDITACVHHNGGEDFEFIAKKNDGTTDLKPHLYQSTPAGIPNQVENVAGQCRNDLSAGDRLELWVRCTSGANKSIVFDHVNLGCLQIGGT